MLTHAGTPRWHAHRSAHVDTRRSAHVDACRSATLTRAQKRSFWHAHRSSHVDACRNATLTRAQKLSRCIRTGTLPSHIRAVKPARAMPHSPSRRDCQSAAAMRKRARLRIAAQAAPANYFPRSAVSPAAPCPRQTARRLRARTGAAGLPQ